MLYIEGEFPEGIDSRKLYEMLRIYKFNVTEMVTCTYVCGTITELSLDAVVAIFYLFNVTTFHVNKKPP